MRILCLLVMLLVLSAACLAQTGETKNLKKVEWMFSEKDFNTEIKEETYPDAASKEKKAHTSKIVRRASTEREKLLIRKAEALYPKDSQETNLPANKMAHEESPYWSFGSFDGVIIARIVSTRAIKYYQEMSEAFRNKKKVTEIEMSSTSLGYAATVQHQNNYEINNEKFEDVDVVSLKLSWGQYCGSLCAMGFSRSKIVIFKKDEPVAMFIDADLGYVVS